MNNLFPRLMYIKIGFETYTYNFGLFVYNNLFLVLKIFMKILKIFMKIPQKLLILIINLFTVFIRMFYGVYKLTKKTLYISVKPLENLIKFFYISLITFFTIIKQKIYNTLVQSLALIVKFNIKIVAFIFKYIINPIYKLIKTKNLNENNITKEEIQGSFPELPFSTTITRLNNKIIGIIKYKFTQPFISLNILLKSVFIRFKELKVILYFNRKNLLKKIIYFMLKQKWYLNAYIYIIKEIIIKDVKMIYNKLNILFSLIEIILKKTNLIIIFNILVKIDISDLIAKKLIVYVYKTVNLIKNIIIKPQYFINRISKFTIHTTSSFVKAFLETILKITPILFLELIPVTFYSFVKFVNTRFVYILLGLNKHLKKFKLDLIFSLIINSVALFIRASNLTKKLVIRTIYKLCKNTLLITLKIGSKILNIFINAYRNVINTSNKLFELRGFLHEKEQNKIHKSIEKPVYRLSSIFYAIKKISYILKRLVYGLIYKTSYTLLYVLSYISYVLKRLKITILNTLSYISNKYKRIIYILHKLSYMFKELTVTLFYKFKDKLSMLLEKILFIFENTLFIFENTLFILGNILFISKKIVCKLKYMLFIFKKLTFKLINKLIVKLTNELTNKLHILNAFINAAFELLSKLKYKAHELIKICFKLYNKTVLYIIYTLNIFKQVNSQLTAINIKIDSKLITIYIKVNSMLSIKSIYKNSMLSIKSIYKIFILIRKLNHTLDYNLLKMLQIIQKLLQKLIYNLIYNLVSDLINLEKVLLKASLRVLMFLIYDVSYLISLIVSLLPELISRIFSLLAELFTLHNLILYKIKQRLEKTEEGRTFKLAMFQIFKVDFAYYTLYKGWFGRWFWRWYWRQDENLYKVLGYIYKKTIDIKQVFFIFIKQLRPYLRKRINYGINIIITSILKPGYHLLKSILAELKIISKSIYSTLKLIPAKLIIIFKSISYVLKSIIVKLNARFKLLIVKLNARSKSIYSKLSNMLRSISYALKSIIFKLSVMLKLIVLTLKAIILTLKLIAFKLSDILKLVIFRTNYILKLIIFKTSDILKLIVLETSDRLQLIYYTTKSTILTLKSIAFKLSDILKLIIFKTSDILRFIIFKLKDVLKLIVFALQNILKSISAELKIISKSIPYTLKLISFKLKCRLKSTLKLIYYILKATPNKFKSIFRFIMILDYIILEYINSVYQNAYLELKEWKNIRKIKRDNKLQRLAKIKETHTAEKEILKINLQTKLQTISEIKEIFKDELQQINTTNEKIQKIALNKKNNNIINNYKTDTNIILNNIHIKPRIMRNPIIENIKSNINIIYNNAKNKIENISNSIILIIESCKNTKKKFHEIRLQLVITKSDAIEIDYNNIINNNYKANIDEITRRINYTAANIYKHHLHEYFEFFNIIKYSYHNTKNEAMHVYYYFKALIDYYKKQVKNISIKNLKEFILLTANKVAEIVNTYIKDTINIYIWITDLKANFRFIIKKISKIKTIRLFKKNNIAYRKPQKVGLISSLLNLVIKISVNLKQDLCIKINNYINVIDINLNILRKVFEYIKYLKYSSKIIYNKTKLTFILGVLINNSINKLGYILYKGNKIDSKTERDISLEFYTLATLNNRQTITDQITVEIYKIRQWLIKILNLKFKNEPEIKISPLNLTKLPLMTLFNGPFKYPFYENVKKYATEMSFIFETSLTSKLLFWYQNNIKLKKSKLSFTPIIFDKKNDIEFKKFEISLHYWKKYKDRDYNIYSTEIFP